MPIIITFTKPDGTVNQTETHDFGEDAAKQNNNIDRLTDWAKTVYLNADGSQPGPNAARSRLAKGAVQAWRDAMKTSERNQDIAELPPPEDIPV